jgi:hypothetical protein
VLTLEDRNLLVTTIRTVLPQFADFKTFIDSVAPAAVARLPGNISPYNAVSEIVDTALRERWHRDLVVALAAAFQHRPEFPGLLAAIDSERHATHHQPPLAKLYDVPFKPSQVFVGRAAELEQLRATLVDDQQAVAVSATVEGIGGIGKTELVVQLIHDPAIRSHFAAIVWLDGGGPLLPQWQRVALQLALPHEGLDPRALIETVWYALQDRGRTLVVLDNAPDWETVRSQLSSQMQLLVTTRERNFGQRAFRHVEVGRLAPPAARALLESLAPHVAGDPVAKRLLEILDGHALALELAGGTMEALGLTASDYMTRLRRGEPDPPLVLQVANYGKTVAACLDVTWDVLSVPARTLWRRASLFAPASAHRELLRVSFAPDDETRLDFQYAGHQADAREQADEPMAFSRGEFDGAYLELRRANVLSRVEGEAAERWAIHRVVRDYGRARLRTPEALLHALALSNWLRRPTIDTAPEIPHFVCAILDSARFGGRLDRTIFVDGEAGEGHFRDVGREIFHRSPIFDSEYFIDFIRGELQDPRALNLILDGLIDINNDVRSQAVRLLERFGHVHEVQDLLVAALDDPDDQVRTGAQRALRDNPSHRVVELLTRVARASRPKAAVAAVEILTAIGKQGSREVDVIPALRALTVSEDAHVCRLAAVSLAELLADAPWELVRVAAGEPGDPQLRARAVAVMYRDPSDQATEILIALLNDSNFSFSSEAFGALRQRGLSEHWRERVHDALVAAYRSVSSDRSSWGAVHAAEQIVEFAAARPHHGAMPRDVLIAASTSRRIGQVASDMLRSLDAGKPD